MEIVRLAAIIGCGLLLPQAIGIVLFLVSGRKGLRFLRVLAPLVAAGVFFAIAYAYWQYEAACLRAEGQYVCGMFGFSAVCTTFGGAFFHLLAGVALQLTLWAMARASKKRSPTGV